MSADLDLSPPEVPEPTFFESLLRYGLFLGAIFQLVCILAVIIPTSKGHEQPVETSDPADTRSTDQNRKAKPPVQQIRQKMKKESKKKR